MYLRNTIGLLLRDKGGFSGLLVEQNEHMTCDACVHVNLTNLS